MAVLTYIETDTGTNVDISAATAVGAYTSTGDKLVMCDVSIDAVAGNGDYVMYVTRQIGGSGSAYRLLPQTTMAAASGLTAIAAQSGWITVRNGDVLTCYVDGLAGDTSTPDWTTRWYELAGVTAAAVADAVLDEATSGHTSAGSFSKAVTDILADTGTDGVKIASGELSTVATASSITTLDGKVDTIDNFIDTEIAAIITHLTDIKGAGWSTETLKAIYSYAENASSQSENTYIDLKNGGRLDLLIDAIKAKTDTIAAAPTAASVADAVWDEAIADHTSVGSFGAKNQKVVPSETINDYKADVSGLATAAALDAVDNYIDTEVAAIKAKTDLIPATPAEAGEYTAAIAAVQADLDNPDQYKADVSALATTAHVQEVEDKVDTADTVVDAIKVKTDQLTFTVAGSVDATATADISGIAGDVWSHANRTLTNQGTSVTSPAEGDPLEIYRDTTVYITLTGIGATTGYTKIWFTVKEDLEDADTDAILQIDTTDRLKYIDGEAGTSTDGLLVIDSEEETADITLLQASAQLLPVYTAYPAFWDLKMLNNGVVSLLSTGNIYIYSTPTRSIM